MKQIFIKQVDKFFQLRKHNLVIQVVFGLCMLFFISGCENFLEIDPPQSQVIGELVFNEKNLADAALAGVYLSVRNNFLSARVISTYMGVYADELDYVGSQAFIWDPFVYNNVLPTTPDISYWSNGYNIIYNINSILEGLENSSKLNVEDKNQIKGEALFLRACVHFYLVNLYGEIPFITATDYNINSKVARMPVQVVYDSIISDLNEAKELLPENYITNERIRANKSVASALLSRVYLYTQEWEKAELESTALINTGTFDMEEDLSKLFLKESTSVIWNLKTYPDTNSHDGSTFYVASASSLNFKGIFLSKHIVDAFESGDKRRSIWVKSGILTNGKTVYYSSKYRETRRTTPSKEYSVIFRIEEQYLIRAEARAHIGNIIGAQQDLNIIRNRADLGDTAAATLNDLLEAVLQERKVELFLELSHRWFDLKRMGYADAVLDPIKSGWDPTDILLPIPESEILLNPNLLPQNPGY
ncbi:MAG: RagB/SusD family nutrient uptake outer membrane protein [Bacteriovorax sp.]|nr:RagB/SusD family nutrient uptake outer membrane protein [Bacteriovorax sp.]